MTAPAAGTISFTGSLYFNGNAIFIDHGGGLISMVCHLSKIDVHQGDVGAQGPADRSASAPPAARPVRTFIGPLA